MLSFLATLRTKLSYTHWLIGQFIIFLLCNIAWEKASFFCLQFDSMQNALICQEYFTDRFIQDTSLFPYPRLVHWAAVPLLHLCGFNAWPFFIVESAFAAVWVFSTYALGQEICSKRTGFWAATLLLWSIQLTVAVRTFLLDYPLAALLTFQLFILVRSRHFTKLWPSLTFLALIPVIAGIKYQYILCIAPILIALSFHLLAAEWSQFWGKGRFFGWSALIAQPLVPLLAAATIIGKPAPMGSSACLFALGMLIVSGGQAWYLYRHHQQANLPRYSAFLLYQLGVALIVPITVWIHTCACLVVPLDYYYSQNICMFTWPGDTWSERLSNVWQWCVGYVICLKSKNMQPISFLLYLIGLAVVAWRPRALKGYAFLVVTTIATSIFFTMYTYNAVRFHAPLLSIRCLIAVFWIEYLPSSWRWLRRGGYVLILAFALCGLGYNGGWLVSHSMPRSNVNIMLNDLIRGNGIDEYYYHFEWPYKPQDTFEYVRSRSEHPEHLVDTYSAWSPGLWFTCDPYNIDWGSLTSGLRSHMENPDDLAFIEQRPRGARNAIFFNEDAALTHLMIASIYGVPSPQELSTIPMSELREEKPHYFCIIADPQQMRAEDWQPYWPGKMIYRWTAPGLEARLYDQFWE